MPVRLGFPTGGSQLDAPDREMIEVLVQGVARHDEITAVRFEGHAVRDEARHDGPRSEAELRSLARARAADPHPDGFEIDVQTPARPDADVRRLGTHRTGHALHRDAPIAP